MYLFAYFYETCLFLSLVLIFEFLAKKVGFCGREDLFWSSTFLVEKKGLCGHQNPALSAVRNPLDITCLKMALV